MMRRGKARALEGKVLKIFSWSQTVWLHEKIFKLKPLEENWRRSPKKPIFNVCCVWIKFRRGFDVLHLIWGAIAQECQWPKFFALIKTFYYTVLALLFIISHMFWRHWGLAHSVVVLFYSWKTLLRSNHNIKRCDRVESKNGYQRSLKSMKKVIQSIKYFYIMSF